MKNGKKIILVEIAGRGGICHYAYNLAQSLSRFNKVVLITGVNYELKDKTREFELIGFFNRFKTNPFFLFRLFRLFNNKEVSVIHLQLSQHPIFVILLCYMAKMFTNKKVVVTAHNVLSHEKRSWEKCIYKRLYSMVDRIIVHAEANRLEIKNSFSVNSKKVNVIPHGNYLFFNDKFQSAPKNTHNILFFGYIREYKGLIHLIRALGLIRKRIPNVKLIIAGRPIEDFSRYDKEIYSLGLKNNIELTLEYIKSYKMKDYFCKANVVALPYLRIYQSGVLQLAYAFGRPVVTTNVGGLSEVVEDGRSGYIVAPGDVKSLAEKLEAILTNQGLQQRMGDYALNLAKTKFSWDSIAGNTFDLYESLNN